MLTPKQQLQNLDKLQIHCSETITQLLELDKYIQTLKEQLEQTI